MLIITYTLIGYGWAQATLSSGGETLTLTPSYTPSSALDHLIDAIITLLQGAETARFLWYTEPGVYEVHLDRHEALVRLWVTERRTSIRWPGEQSWVEIFSATEDLHHLAIQVRSQLRQLRHTHGNEGYRATWRWDFPVGAQCHLESLIQEEKHRRQAMNK